MEESSAISSATKSAIAGGVAGGVALLLVVAVVVVMAMRAAGHKANRVSKIEPAREVEGAVFVNPGYLDVA